MPFQSACRKIPGHKDRYRRRSQSKSKAAAFHGQHNPTTTRPAWRSRSSRSGGCRVWGCLTGCPNLRRRGPPRQRSSVAGDRRPRRAKSGYPQAWARERVCSRRCPGPRPPRSAGVFVPTPVAAARTGRDRRGRAGLCAGAGTLETYRSRRARFTEELARGHR